MGDIVLKNMKRVTKEAMNPQPSEKQLDKVFRDEKVINHLETMITGYLVKISNLALTEKQSKIVTDLFYTISDIERA